MSQPVNITFLGGLGDIGRNCAVLESGGEAMVLDCGVLFPNEEQPGIQFILPDLDYISKIIGTKNPTKIRGCLITHAHEDHIGALRFLMDEVDCPIYGSAFSLGVVERRLAEWGISPELIEVNAGEAVKIGPFECEFLNVTHSVPGGHITAIKTPQGVILHSSDFKLDQAPVDGQLTDLERIAEISASPGGIRLLLADSTNSDQEGATESESSIGKALLETMSENDGRRIFVSCFSSHLHRVQQIADAAKECGRHISVMGMSMKANVDLAIQLGILDIDGYVDIADVGGGGGGGRRGKKGNGGGRYADHEICIITPGSQGEPGSSLATAAEQKNRWVRIGENDAVILSADPIPGNEARTYRMLNAMVRAGAKIFYGSRLGLHTSGHGKRAELTTLHQMAGAEWFTPVHGEYRHLVAHKNLAIGLGMDEKRVLLAVDGDQIEMSDSGLKLRQKAAEGAYLLGQGKLVDTGTRFIDERLEMSQDGVVSVAIPLMKGRLTGEVLVESRGWVDADVRKKLEVGVGKAVARAVRNALKKSKPPKDKDKAKGQKGAAKGAAKGTADLSKIARRAARAEITQSTDRYPAILVHLLNR